jgi:hypothetical protein
MSGLPLVSLPKYTATLPSTKQKVEYRPFTVREEKNLLIAMQEDSQDCMITAIKTVISDCTMNKLEVGSLSQVDIEYLFIMIRNKSMGEGVDVEVECSNCGHKTPMVLDLNKIEIKYPTMKIDPVIQLDSDLWVTVKLPTLEMGFAMNAAKNYDQVMSILSKCIVSILKGESSFDCKDQKQSDIIDWLEKLPREKFDMIDAFFGNIPKIVLNDAYTCVKCRSENVIQLEGLQSFFD